MPLDKTTTLIRRALQGEAAVWDPLLERLRPRLVLWVATRMSKDLRAKVEPEDVAQEVLMAVHQGLPSFRGDTDSSFFAWLFRIAENRIRDQATHFGAQKRQLPEPQSFTVTSPSMAAVHNERLRQVASALTELSPNYQQVLQLRRFEARSIAETAELMGRSEGAVRVLYCRALKALRSHLAESGALD